MTALDALARTWFAAPAGDRPAVAVAVSGGGDSMALLDLVATHAPPAGVAVHAVTLDHGLRPEAAAEAAMVAAFCAARDVPHATLRWQGWDGAGNLQAAARAARYRLIGAWARDQGMSEVMLGHTRDDVAETFLIRLGRAAGLDGLAHMAPRFEREGMRWTRPLLHHDRATLRAHLRARGISWIEDPSNHDPRFARVRARAALTALAPLGITADSIAHSAWGLLQAREAMARHMAGEWARLVRLDGGDLIVSGQAEAETRRRLLSAALHRVGGTGWPVRAAALADLMARLEHQPRHTLGGCLVTRKGGDWRIAREWQAVKGHVVPFDQEWDGRWRLAGPGTPGMEIRALGAGIALCPDWRATGLPRASLMAGPAVWRESELIAAPLARKSPEWRAILRPCFATAPIVH